MSSDFRTWLYEYTVSAYEDERQTIHKIRDRASNLIALMITPGLAIAAYLALNFRGKDPFAALSNYLFFAPWCISVVLFLYLAVVISFKILKPDNFSRIPPPVEFSDYQKKRANDDQEKVLEDIKQSLLDDYIKSHKINFDIVQSKQSLLDSTQKSTAIAFLFILLSLGRWGYNFYTNEQEELPVKILSTTLSSCQKDVQVTTNNTAPVAPITPALPQRRMALDNAEPAMPKRRMVFEHLDPTVKNREPK